MNFSIRLNPESVISGAGCKRQWRKAGLPLAAHAAPLTCGTKAESVGPVTKGTRTKMLLVMLWLVLEPEGLSDSQVLRTI